MSSSHLNASAPSPASPTPAITSSGSSEPAGSSGPGVPGKMVNGVAIPAPGYIPKAGKLTVEDIEAELALLMERMEFLNNALEEIKKEE